MVVAHLTYDGLVKILKEHHWEIASNDYWNDYDRIIFEKDGENIVVQYKKMYGFPFVVKFLRSLDIDPPDDCVRSFDQLEAYKKRKADEEKNNGNDFKKGAN